MVEHSEPKTASDWFTLGTSYGENGDYESAIVCYQKAIEIDRSFKNAYYYLGSIILKHHKPAKALMLFEEAIQLDPSNRKEPSNSVLYNICGISHEKLGDDESALNCFKKAAQIDPNDEHAYLNIAMHYHRKKESDGAIKYYRSTVEIHPENIEAWNNLALIYFELNDNVMSLKVYEQAILNNPDAAELYLGKGRIYSKAKMFDDEISLYIGAIKIIPHDHRLWNYYGTAAYDHGWLGVSERAYEIADHIEFGFHFHSDEEVTKVLEYVRYGGLPPI